MRTAHSPCGVSCEALYRDSPAIEKTYGRPVDHWFAIPRAAGDRKHMELVSLLKTEHGLGHGHANALVAYHLAKR